MSDPAPPSDHHHDADLRWNHANLLLLVPFLALVTPLFNRTEPVLLGWPFYYWGYLAAVLAGCACIGAMVHLTRDRAEAEPAAGPEATP